MMMNKRKQSDVSSDSSGTSMLYNSETVFDLNAESSSGSARKIPRFNLNLNLNLNSSTEFGLFDDVQLNGAPFTDFFLSKPAKVSEKYSQNSTAVCLDLKLSPPCGDTVLSDDATPVCRCERSTYSTDSDSETETETETETVLDVMPLRMYIPDDVNVMTVPVEVEWTVKKVLTRSDCNDQHRLLISRNIAEPHILNNLDESSRKEVESSGLALEVFDCDTGSWVDQKLKRWPSNGSIALMDNWKRDFVVRRGLKEGDEVGLCYKRKVLLFSVLQRAPLIEN